DGPLAVDCDECPRLKDIVLILCGAVVKDFMNHLFRLSLELPPYPPCSRLPCRVYRDSDQAKTSISFLWIRLGPPPFGAGGLVLCPRIVEADRIVDCIAGHPGFGSD